jgi:hypothetical protein
MSSIDKRHEKYFRVLFKQNDITDRFVDGISPKENTKISNK